MNVHLLDESDIVRGIVKASKRINNALSYCGPARSSTGLIIDNTIQKYILDDGKNIHQRIIKPFILDAVIRSEGKSGGSGEICLSMISSQIESVSKKIKAGISKKQIQNENKKKIADISRLINNSSRKLNKSDADKLIDRNFILDDQKRIASNIIEKSNIKSQIFLERSNKNETILSFSQGYNFEIPISEDILLTFNRWERKNVEVLIIDGIIESVGEIHHLLERASAEKNPIIVFVRHLSEEVKSTLMLNLKRSTIDLIPIEVGFNENTLNILNDIAICCNSDIVSSYKGDLISTSSSGHLPSVDSITVTKRGINIINVIPENSLTSHLKYLENRRNDSHEPQIKELFDNRIKSLSSGKILVSIGNDLLRKDGQSVEKFDKFFREIRSLIQNGVVYKSMINMDGLGFDMLDDYPHSPASIFFALKYSISAILNIFSIRRGLILDSV